MAGVLLEAVDLRPEALSVEHQALQLSVGAGQVLTLLGESAQQVSAWVACLAGLEDAAQGEVLFEGRTVNALDKSGWQAMRTHMAFLDRNSRLLSVQTLLNNVVLPAAYHRLGERDALLERARHMLDELDVEPEHFDLLPAYVDQYAYTAALMVRVLLMNPKVILLDDFLRLYNRSAGNALLSYMLNHVREQQMAAIIHNHDVGQLLTQHNRAIYFGHDDIICFDPASDMRSIGEERIQRMLGNVYLS